MRISRFVIVAGAVLVFGAACSATVDDETINKTFNTLDHNFEIECSDEANQSQAFLAMQAGEGDEALDRLILKAKREEEHYSMGANFPYQDEGELFSLPMGRALLTEFASQRVCVENRDEFRAIHIRPHAWPERVINVPGLGKLRSTPRVDPGHLIRFEDGEDLFGVLDQNEEIDIDKVIIALEGNAHNKGYIGLYSDVGRGRHEVARFECVGLKALKFKALIEKHPRCQ